MTYRLLKKTNLWGRHGQPINETIDVVADHTDLRAAFQACAEATANAGPGATYAARAVKFSVVGASAYQPMHLIDLYEQVVGPLTFAALCAAQGDWWIDLDEWLAAGAVA